MILVAAAAGLPLAMWVNLTFAIEPYPRRCPVRRPSDGVRRPSLVESHTKAAGDLW